MIARTRTDETVVVSQNEVEFAGFGESSADAPAVPIDVVSGEGASDTSEAEALAKLKWEQKKEQLYLGFILFAATLAVFIEAGANRGLQMVEMDTNLANATMSCTDPRPDPLTNSTVHFGACCGTYGVTPKPLWVLLLQSLLAALVFDLSGHMWNGKAALFAFEEMSLFSFSYLMVQGILAMISTYSILKKYDYADNGWDNYSGLLIVWLNSSAAPFVATIFTLALREDGRELLEAKRLLQQEIGDVKYSVLGFFEKRNRVNERYEEFLRSDTRNARAVGNKFISTSLMMLLCLFPPAMFITHFVPAIVLYFPLATVLYFMVQEVPVYLYEEPVFPIDSEKPHSVKERLVYVPARALISSWIFCSVMIIMVLIPTWIAIFYANTSWAGALVQDWESRDTGRFFECLNIQFQSVTGGADAVGLIF